MLQWKVHSRYMNENQLIVTMFLSKNENKVIHKSQHFVEGMNLFFLIRIKNIIYLKCVHAYSSGTA